MLLGKARLSDVRGRARRGATAILASSLVLHIIRDERARILTKPVLESHERIECKHRYMLTSYITSVVHVNAQ
jgi:hypothetical protein